MIFVKERVNIYNSSKLLYLSHIEHHLFHLPSESVTRLWGIRKPYCMIHKTANYKHFTFLAVQYTSFY